MWKGNYSCSHCDACPLVGQSSGCLHVSSHVRSFGKPYVRHCRCLSVKQAEHANNKRTGWIKLKDGVMPYLRHRNLPPLPFAGA